MKYCIWIHDHEILYEFIVWIQTWIHMKYIVKSYVRIHMYEFIYNSCCWNHDNKKWNHVWIHNYEFMWEFSVMKNNVKSYLNSWKWILIGFHWWIRGTEFNTELMMLNSILKSTLNSGTKWFLQAAQMLGSAWAILYMALPYEIWHCPVNCRLLTASPTPPTPSSKHSHIHHLYSLCIFSRHHLRKVLEPFLFLVLYSLLEYDGIFFAQF